MQAKIPLFLILLTVSSCARNIYSTPPNVEGLLTQGLNELELPKGASPYFYLNRTGMDHQIYLMYYTAEQAQKKRLVNRSGRKIRIGGVLYPLISHADLELSDLRLERGQAPDFGGVLIFGQGPWVSWSSESISGSWLEPPLRLQRDTTIGKE